MSEICKCGRKALPSLHDNKGLRLCSKCSAVASKDKVTKPVQAYSGGNLFVNNNTGGN